MVWGAIAQENLVEDVSGRLSLLLYITYIIGGLPTTTIHTDFHELSKFLGFLVVLPLQVRFPFVRFP